MMRGSFVPVEEGGVELDDLLYVDMTMSVGDEILVNKDNFDIAARDIRIEGVILEGLGEALIGKKPGDLATLEATIPDDHENIDIRGKSAKFEFTVREIKRLELPPIDEEFLKSGGFESESELRDMLRASMEARLDQTINRVMHGQISDHLIDNTKIEIPQDLSQRQTDRSLRRRRISMLREGIPETMVDKAMDELQGEARDQVVRDLKLYFILEKIAEDRDIDVREEQVNGAIAQIAQQSNKRFDRVRDELSKGDGLLTLYLQLRDEEVLSTLLNNAEITDAKAPKKTEAKKTSAKKK